MAKAELGSYVFAAQYQQDLLPLSNGVIKQERSEVLLEFS